MDARRDVQEKCVDEKIEMQVDKRSKKKVYQTKKNENITYMNAGFEALRPPPARVRPLIQLRMQHLDVHSRMTYIHESILTQLLRFASTQAKTKWVAQANYHQSISKINAFPNHRSNMIKDPNIKKPQTKVYK